MAWSEVCVMGLEKGPVGLTAGSAFTKFLGTSAQKGARLCEALQVVL